MPQPVSVNSISTQGFCSHENCRVFISSAPTPFIASAAFVRTLIKTSSICVASAFIDGKDGSRLVSMEIFSKFDCLRIFLRGHVMLSEGLYRSSSSASMMALTFTSILFEVIVDENLNSPFTILEHL